MILLIKITPIPEKEMAIMAVPENCADKIITLYHGNFFLRTPGCHKNLSHN